MSQPIIRTVSMQATRSHPWDPWLEPAQARYWGVTVEIVQRFDHYTLIRRPDGLSCVVETADLLEVRK